MAAGKTKYARSEKYSDPNGDVVAVTMQVVMPAEWEESAQAAARDAVDRGVEALDAIVNGLHLERQPDLFRATQAFQRTADDLRERGIGTTITAGRQGTNDP